MGIYQVQINHVQTIDTEESLQQRQALLSLLQVMEVLMGGQEYRSLDTRASFAMLLVDASAPMAAQSQAEQVADTVSRLQAGELADLGAVDASMQVLRAGLDQGDAPAGDLARQMFYSCNDEVAQARVVGNLLTDAGGAIIEEVLGTGDAFNYLGPKLGEARIEKLRALASDTDPVRQNARLLHMARDILKPADYTPEDALSDPKWQHVAALVGDHPNRAMIEAIRSMDVQRVGKILDDSADHASLARSVAIAELRDVLARPLDMLVAADNAPVSNFSFQTYSLLQPAANSWGGDEGSGDPTTFDSGALRDLLLQPENQPSSLAISFGRPRKLQPLALETIARALNE